MASESQSAQPATNAGASWRIWRIIGTTIAVWKRNFVLYTLIFIVAGLPNLVFNLVWGPPPGSQPQFTGPFIAAATITIVVAILLQCFAYGVTTVIAFDSLKNRQVSLTAALRASVNRLLPYIGAGICTFLILLVGYILLIIPGIIASIALVVVAQACILEGTGPIDSLRRSAALTKGSRWKIFGLAVVIVLIVLGIMLLVGIGSGLVVGVWFLAAGGQSAVVSALISVFGGILSLIIGALFGSMGVIFPTVLYVELLAAKDTAPTS